MTYTKDTLRQIFQQPFNANEWQQMLQHYFHAKELKAEPEPINGTSDEEKGYYLGAIDTTDNYRIGLFYYQIQHGNVARKRVGLRNLVKSFINPNWGEFDAALVVFDSGSVWRLSFVCDIKGENTAAKRFTYVFGESDNYYNTPVGRFDALQRNGISFENIKDAFSVERLNKDFFNGYKERYVKFLNHINEDTKENRDYVKKLLGRLVFLQFLQKKGWMGVPANQQGWNGGDKFYLNHLIENYEGNNRLLSDVLEPLFFNTLNERRTNDLADSRLGENIKIPYLNGGLFDKDDLDKKDIDFPYKYFKELMDFFAKYNFTIDENDPEDSEIGIDPEMLGHIFENLLEDNKDKGAFYTPKEIVQYMSQESVAQYLKSHTSEELHTAIDSLITQRVVEPILQNKENARLVNKALSVVKVCDPAIGSGAFPMGVLNVLFDCRHLLYGFIGKNEDFSYAKVKRDIIQNNIYGVDIEKGAVDIARLRFWLALVVDENEPQPLPNLDYKIMCGDSLLHRFPLDAPFQNVLKDYNQKNGTHYTLDDYRQWVYDYTDISDHTQKDDFRQNIEDIKRAVKTELNDKEKGKIAKVRGAIDNLQMEDMFGGKKNEKKIKALQKELKALEQQRAEIESNKIYDQVFEWRFEFPALLDENGDFAGFDIVIGNPPYIDSETMVKIMPDLRNQYTKSYDAASGNWDMFIAFIELGIHLLKNDGVFSNIVPNKLIAAKYGVELRDILSKKDIIEIRDYSRIDVFATAAVYPITIIFRNGDYRGKTSFTVMGDIKNVRQTQAIASNIINNHAYWDVFFVDERRFKIIEKINRFHRLREMPIDILGAATVADAYEIKDMVKELNEDDAKGFKLINSGTIDPYMPLWGIKPCRYIKGCYIKPIVPHNMLRKYSEMRYRQSISPKIIIASMTTRYEACIDLHGEYIAGKSTTILLGDVPMLYFLVSVINSKLASFWLNIIFNSLKMSGGAINIGRNEIQMLPVPNICNDFRELIDIILEKTKNAQSMSIDTEKNKIDLLVYHLYGLTYDEVLIVDPETPITREEYETFNK